MVSIGRALARPEEISAPSPRTTINGAVIPNCVSFCSARPIRESIMPIRRAFSRAVRARFGPFRRDERWCDALTGRPEPARMISATRCSCAGLRVANFPATAKPDTPARCASSQPARAASSSAAASAPAWSCPPARTSTGSPSSASLSPCRSRSASPNPINTSAARPPGPSTSALVAKVVDNEARVTSCGAAPACAITAAIAAPMPSARS